LAKKRKFTDENGKTYYAKEKKPFYKKVWFWLLAGVVLIIAINMGGGDDQAAETASTGANTSSEMATESGTEEEVASLLAMYEAIQLGDILGDTTVGTPREEIVSQFGEPDSTSQSTSANGGTAEFSIWSSPEGGELLSTLTVEFTDGYATGKSVSELPVEKGTEITLEKFNSIPTDGTYTYEQAVADLGNPDSFIEHIWGGVRTVLPTWTTNASGGLGANFQITFEDGVATSKSHFGLE